MNPTDPVNPRGSLTATTLRLTLGLLHSPVVVSSWDMIQPADIYVILMHVYTRKDCTRHLKLLYNSLSKNLASLNFEHLSPQWVKWVK